MADQNRIPIEFTFKGDDLQKMQAEMDDMYKKALAIQNTFKGGNGTKEAEKDLKKIAQSYEYMHRSSKTWNEQTQKSAGLIGGLNNKAKQLKQSMESATNPNDVKKYNKELLKTRNQIKELKNTTNGWGKALGSFQFKFNALGNIAANVASSITRNVTRALREAVQTVIDFEKSFAEVLTLLNSVDKNKFKDILKEQSVSIMKKYGLALKDVNKAMFDAISAGVKVGDVYDVLSSSAKLAIGGVTDLSSATKGIASVLNAFSLEMSEAENVASAFFQAQKFGITYIDDMVASMGRANTIASLSGASYRDMLAAFTAITKSGLNTEEAVTGLRNVFKELVSPSKEAADELKRLGIAYGATAVKQRTFIGVLDDLNDAYKKDNEVIPKVFGNIRGLTGIMGIVGDRYEVFKDVLTQVNDEFASSESLNDAYAEQMDTIAKKVDVLRSSWDALLVTLGKTDEVKGIIGEITSLVSSLDEYVQMVQLLNRLRIDDVYDLGFLEKYDFEDDVMKLIEDRTALIGANSDEIIKYREKYNTKIEELLKDETEYNMALLAVYQDQLDYIKKLQDAKEDDAALKIIEEQEKAEKEAIRLSEELAKKELDYEKARLSTQKSINESIIKLREDSYQNQSILADLNYEYEKKIVELTIDDERLRNLKIEDLRLKHYVKLQELRNKYNPPPTTLQQRIPASPEADIIGGDRQDIKLPSGNDDGLATKLGYTTDALEAISDFTDEFVKLADARIDAINREIDASNERVNSLEADRQYEWERMQAGYANNLALKERELADERKRRQQLRVQEQKALQDKKKAADAQVVINTLLQLSELAVAAARTFAANSSIPLGVGVAISIAAIAAMVGAFVAFKANAADAVSSGYAEGVIDLDGKGTETSDSIPARLSKGESVMTAKTTKKNKRTLKDMQEDPNHPLFRIINREGANVVWNRLTEEMSDNVFHIKSERSKDDRLLNEMKRYHGKVEDRPYSYERGGYRYTVQGNVITKAKI